MEVILKKWSSGDKNQLIALCNHVDRTYLSDRLPFPYTQADALYWFRMVEASDGENGLFRAIEVDGKIIGSISIEQKEDVFRQDAQIGYMLDKAYERNGIMTQAVGQICTLAFKELKLIRITGLVYEPNIASGRVLQKNGFTLEGIKRNAVKKNARIYNLYIYGKTV